MHGPMNIKFLSFVM